MGNLREKGYFFGVEVVCSTYCMSMRGLDVFFETDESISALISPSIVI